MAVGGDVGILTQELFQKGLAQKLLRDQQIAQQQQREIDNAIRMRQLALAEEDQLFQREERAYQRGERARAAEEKATGKRAVQNMRGLITMEGLDPDTIDREATMAALGAGITVPKDVSDLTGQTRKKGVIDRLRATNPEAAAILEAGGTPTESVWLGEAGRAARDKAEIERQRQIDENRQKLELQYRPPPTPREPDQPSVYLVKGDEITHVTPRQVDALLKQGWRPATAAQAGKSGGGRGSENQSAAAAAEPILAEVEALSGKINTISKDEGGGLLGGPSAKLSGAARGLKALAGLDQEISEYESLIAAFTPMVARALGHVGVLTEQDVQSAREVFPQKGDTKELAQAKLQRARRLISGLSAEQLADLPIMPDGSRPDPSAVYGEITGKRKSGGAQPKVTPPSDKPPDLLWDGSQFVRPPG